MAHTKKYDLSSKIAVYADKHLMYRYLDHLQKLDVFPSDARISLYYLFSISSVTRINVQEVFFSGFWDQRYSATKTCAAWEN